MPDGWCKFTPADADRGWHGPRRAADQGCEGNTVRGQFLRAVLSAVDILIRLLALGRHMEGTECDVAGCRWRGGALLCSRPLCLPRGVLRARPESSTCSVCRVRRCPPCRTAGFCRADVMSYSSLYCQCLTCHFAWDMYNNKSLLSEYSY